MKSKPKCQCGAFALGGTPYCSRCKRIHDLEKELDDAKKSVVAAPIVRSLKTQLESCALQREALEKKIAGLEYKNKYPFWVKIKEWEGNMNEDYLKRILEAAKIAPHCFIFEWGKN